MGWTRLAKSSVMEGFFLQSFLVMVKALELLRRYSVASPLAVDVEQPVGRSRPACSRRTGTEPLADAGQDLLLPCHRVPATLA